MILRFYLVGGCGYCIYIPSSPHMFGSEKSQLQPQELRELVGVKASKASKGRVQVNMLGLVAI